MAYTALMLATGVAAQALARDALTARGYAAVRVMAGPEPLTPFRRQIVADVGEGYVIGEVDFLGRPRFVTDGAGPLRRGDADPAVAAAARTARGAAFLRWARFPFFIVDRRPEGTVVHLVDARYTVDPDARFGALSVTLPAR